MPELITELLGRAETGISTNPFRCKTESGRHIYVKPAGVLSTSLIAEWLGGRLAQHMGLPCAEIGIIEVPQALATAVNTTPEWSDFKAGIGFGSYSMGENYVEMTANDCRSLSSTGLAELLVFDYWIKNGDRQLTGYGGNPNTLVDSTRTKFCVIDHDNAFDENFDMAQFRRNHLAARFRNHWQSDRNRSLWIENVRNALAIFHEIWQELPHQWLYSDLDNSNEPKYTPQPYEDILSRPLTNADTFWNNLLS